MGKSTLGMAIKISFLLTHGICLCMQWMASVLDKSSMEYFNCPVIHSDFLEISSLCNGYL